MTKEQLFFENWNLFWNAFGAIGTTICSLITAVVVIVAVMQYRQPFVKKLKIDFSLGFVNFGEEPKMYYELSFINSGIRECIISSISIKGKKENIFILSPPELSGYNNPKLPIRLEQEQRSAMFFEYDDIKNLIKKQYELGWKPKYKQLRIYVKDSSGEVYCEKFKIKMSGFKK